MPRDAKRMRPVKAWAVLAGNRIPADFDQLKADSLPVYKFKVGAKDAALSDERIARVLITELPPKRKRHAP